MAQSFARTFFRNAINNGLVPVECDTGDVVEGDRLVIEQRGSMLEMENVTRGVRRTATALPPMMTDILDAGGIVEFKRRGGWSR